jgi:4-azaleucine resistance transporter AzlC
MDASPTRLKEFLSGCRDEAPILLGVMPFGMIYGVLALAAGLPPFVAQAMSAVVFAGSAQFVATQLIRESIPAVVLVLTLFVVNLRHALYSATVAPALKGLRLGWKALLAYLLTDEAFAVAITRYQRHGPTEPPPHHEWYFLGAGVTLWASWQVSTAVGIFLGTQVPESWSLDFTLALTFIALVVPALKDRASTAAAIAASVLALLVAGLPYKLGLVTAAIAGVVIGLAVEGRSEGRSA